MGWGQSKFLPLAVGPLAAFACAFAASTAISADAPNPVRDTVGGVEFAGKLANGTRYVIHRPAQWNGVLVLDPDLPEGRRAALAVGLHRLGYATGARARDVTNWQIRDGASDLVQLKALFTDRFTKPTRTILIGGSLGGLVVRDAGETYPDQFEGVVPTCGGGAGLIAMYNNRLDVAFALKTLLAPDDRAVEIARITDDRRNAGAMRAAVDRALQTPQGRARLALIGAIGQISGWPTGADRPPAANDYEAELKAIGDAAALILNLKADVEKAAGGVFSWNVGVDYAAMYRQAGPQAMALTDALYRQAGLSLDADLAKLGAAPRVQADAEALAWARANGSHTGRLRRPTFVLFTAVDPRAPLSEYRAYQRTVDGAGAGATALLRQAGVSRSGHCVFSTAELLAGVKLMDERLTSGRWPAVTPAALNARAADLERQVEGVGDARFADFPDTPVYPRQFNAEDRAPAGAVKTPGGAR